MYFYEFILVTLYICTSDTAEMRSIVTDTGIDAVSPCSVGIVFFVKLNNTSNEDCHVEVTPDDCRLRDETDGDILKIMGGCTCYIPRGNAKILKLVAPILDPYDRQGYCTLYVDSKSNSQINKRETVKINFNTSIQKDNEESDIKRCENKDEDPLNNCQPVNCDQFYNGRKPVYNRRLKKCVDIPPCLVTDDTYSDVVYNPVSNRCIKHSIVKKDIKSLKTFTNYKDYKRRPKDVIIITNSTGFSNEGINMVDIADPQSNIKNSKIKHVKKHSTINIFDELILKYGKTYNCAVVLLGSIILIQCVLIGTMCCFKKTRLSEKKVVRKFFNNENDEDSVTTPLISTSIMDTRTTENQFPSESSTNIAMQSKCYKSCEKEKNVKSSTSDDILSKCVNRRDWKNHHKSIVTENESSVDANKIKQAGSKHTDSYNDYKDTNFKESKVVFKDETLKNEINKPKTLTLNDDGSENTTVDVNKPSEEVICQTFSCYDTKAECVSEKKSDSITKSMSTEKAAQTYFSKDSIDAILSERGYIYMAGGDLSKYTLSVDSGKVKSTEISNKASKNIVRYFQSLLGRSKQGSQSDPGKEKDLQLLHMSRASLYSSSNDSE